MQSKPRLVDLRGGRHIPPPKPGDIRPQTPRRSQLKLKRKRLRAVVTASICVGALLTAYAVHAASYLPRFTYQNVLVNGAKAVSPGDVQNLVQTKLEASSRGFISGRNIFVFDFAPLSQEIAANFPLIKDAQVTRDTSLGNGLVVTLEERTAYARWCEGGSDAPCFVMDEDGVVFAPGDDMATSSFATPYVFTGALSTTTIAVATPPYGEVYAGTHFSGIQSLIKMLQDAGTTPLGAELENDSDFSIPLAEGFYLKASYGEDPQTLVKNLTLILDSDALKGKEAELEYVDLRFGNRVYYKLKGQTQTAQ